jgi:hypothetical protein
LTFSAGAVAGAGGELLLAFGILFVAPGSTALNSDIDKKVLPRNEVININTKNDLEKLFPFKRSFKNV